MGFVCLRLLFFYWVGHDACGFWFGMCDCVYDFAGLFVMFVCRVYVACLFCDFDFGVGATWVGVFVVMLVVLGGFLDAAVVGFVLLCYLCLLLILVNLSYYFGLVRLFAFEGLWVMISSFVR